METAESSALETEDTSAVLGEVVEISGSRATVLLSEGTAPLCPPIGSLLIINTRTAVVLCLITAMKVPHSADDRERGDMRTIQVELVGELARERYGLLGTFQRGVSSYPKLGDYVHPASRQVLGRAYHFGGNTTVEVGTIKQDSTIPAMVSVPDLLGKHFAIVGSTGSGKSCTTALILRQVLSKLPNGHVVLLDPHSEYGSCFDDAAELITLSDLRIPHWFLNFEEIVEVLIGDTKKYVEEVEILRDLIPIAKRQFGANRGQSSAPKLAKAVGGREKFSVDVPVPYRIADVISLIDEQMGRLEMKNSLAPFKSLKARIETMSQDPRYGFMFGSRTVEDNLKDVLKQVFRVPVAGKPITIIQLTGLPAEIVNVVVSVIARLAFDLAVWSEGKVPITLVCEEAHRYVPRESSAGFEPTKRAISRIAKEGRKYGISLCIVSQRPGDLDPTILSQCSTLLTMRLTNESDQRIVTSALSDAAQSLVEFLPSLGTRESIIFGEGVTLPSRVLISELPESALPAGNTEAFETAWSNDISDDTFLDGVITRWRVVGQISDTGAETAQAPAAADPVDETVAQADQPEPAAHREPAPVHQLHTETPAVAHTPPQSNVASPPAQPSTSNVTSLSPASMMALGQDPEPPIQSPALQRLAQRIKGLGT